MTFRKICTIAATAMFAAFLSGPAAADGDPTKGEKVFKRCKACHQVGEDAKNRTGPHLNGIVCRAAGSVADYNYSDPMTAKAGEGLVWNAEDLDKYLENPTEFLGGRSKMTLKLKKEGQREDVIAYLAQFNAEGGMYGDGEAPDAACAAE